MDHVREPYTTLLTAREVAQRLHISESKVYMLILDRDLPSVRIGRAVRVPVPVGCQARSRNATTWATSRPTPIANGCPLSVTAGRDSGASSSVVGGVSATRRDAPDARSTASALAGNRSGNNTVLL